MNLQPEPLQPALLWRIQQTAERAARAGSQVLQGFFRQGHLETSTKGRDDFVTNADYASEKAILGCIHEAHPDHGILAEEAGRVASHEAPSGFTWVVDPLDGTRNFLRGLPVYAVSIACLHGSQPVVGVVLDPQRGDLYRATLGGGAFCNDEPISISAQHQLSGSFLATGYPFRHGEALDLYLACFREIFREARGVRRCGAAALDLANTAAGVYDGFFEFGLSAWDIAAGALLIREAGGIISDLDGGDNFLARGNVIAGGPGVWAELRNRVNRHVDEAALAKLFPDALSQVPGDTTSSVTGNPA